MNGDSIPDEDHVLRHVKGRHIEMGDISGAAFRLRKDETALSFNWMEFDSSRNQTVEQQVQLIRESFPLARSRNDRLARLNILAAKNRVSSEHIAGKVIDFKEDGYEGNPSHCYMTVEEIDDMVGDLLAQCILDKFPAVI